MTAVACRAIFTRRPASRRLRSDKRTGYLALDTSQTHSYDATKKWLSAIQRSGSSMEKAEHFYDETGGHVTQAVLDDDLANPGDATVAYQYDNLHRLTREYCAPAEGSGRLKYGYQYYYDAVGNRTKMEEYKPYWNEETEQYDWLWKPTSYQYSSRNELTKVSQEDWYYDSDTQEWYLASSGGWDQLYDLRGNLTKKGSTGYYWDSQDRLTKVYDGSKTVEYKYDLMGRRVAKKVNSGAWKWFFYDGLKVVAEGTATNDKMFYTLSPGVIGGIVCRDNNGTKYWYHYDRLGNVMGVTDSNGNVVTLYTMEAFGNVLQCSNGGDFSGGISDPQPYHLTTKEYDPDAELYYFNARWYDATTGRFASQEVASVFQNYVYCGNNPTGHVDKDGFAPAPVPIDPVTAWLLGLPKCNLQDILKNVGPKGCSSALAYWHFLRSLERLLWFLTQPINITDGYGGATLPQLQAKMPGVVLNNTDPRFNPNCPSDFCSVLCTCLHEYIHVLEYLFGMPENVHKRTEEIPSFLVGTLCHLGSGLIGGGGLL